MAVPTDRALEGPQVIARRRWLWRVPEGWQARAGCKGADPDLFFPVPGDRATLANAKATCAVCPVRRECLTYALGTGSVYGVWGGADELERRALIHRFGRRAIDRIWRNDVWESSRWDPSGDGTAEASIR